jgi:ribosomal protein L24E
MNSTPIISKCMYSTNKINTGRTTSIYYKNKNKNIRFDIQCRTCAASRRSPTKLNVCGVSCKCGETRNSCLLSVEK